MRLPVFEYLEPRSLKQASKTLAMDPAQSVLLAGGTDLLVNVKHRVIQPKKVIDLKGIPKLAYISEGRDGLRIGTLTTLHDLASSPVVNEKHPVLIQAAKEIGAYAHQVMGTLGGNLCQGNRCRFYNQSLFWRSVRPPCYKAGGEACYVVPVRNVGARKVVKCYSTYCGDMAPVLIALDSEIKVVGPDRERSFPLKKLYTLDGKKPLSLKKGELLKEVLIPTLSGRILYLKWRLRDSLEFPVVSLALLIEQGVDKRIEKVKIVFSGVGSGPVETPEAEKIMQHVIPDDQIIEKVAKRAMKEISPVRTSISSPAYKRKIAGILLRQALEQLMK